MAGEPVLRRSSSHADWVRHLQTLLQGRGHDPGPIDGDFGPLTEAAVRAFQEANGCAVDGIVGPETWAALATEEPDTEGLRAYVEAAPVDSMDGMTFTGADLDRIKSEPLPPNVEGVDYSRSEPLA